MILPCKRKPPSRTGISVLSEGVLNAHLPNNWSKGSERGHLLTTFYLPKVIKTTEGPMTNFLLTIEGPSDYRGGPTTIFHLPEGAPTNSRGRPSEG